MENADTYDYMECFEDFGLILAYTLVFMSK